jgi:precorrin-6B methylase 2
VRGETLLFGLPDEVFLRTGVPMTKSEVRAVSLAKLQLQPDAIVYDWCRNGIGLSGTGTLGR